MLPIILPRSRLMETAAGINQSNPSAERGSRAREGRSQPEEAFTLLAALASVFVTRCLHAPGPSFFLKYPLGMVVACPLGRSALICTCYLALRFTAPWRVNIVERYGGWGERRFSPGRPHRAPHLLAPVI